MYRSFYAGSEMLDFAFLAFGIFLVVFVGIVVRLFLKKREGFDALAHMPLEEEGPAPSPVGQRGSK